MSEIASETSIIPASEAAQAELAFDEFNSLPNQFLMEQYGINNEEGRQELSYVGRNGTEHNGTLAQVLTDPECPFGGWLKDAHTKGGPEGVEKFLGGLEMMAPDIKLKIEPKTTEDYDRAGVRDPRLRVIETEQPAPELGERADHKSSLTPDPNRHIVQLSSEHVREVPLSVRELLATTSDTPHPAQIALSQSIERGDGQEPTENRHARTEAKTRPTVPNAPERREPLRTPTARTRPPKLESSAPISVAYESRFSSSTLLLERPIVKSETVSAPIQIVLEAPAAQVLSEVTYTENSAAEASDKTVTTDELLFEMMGDAFPVVISEAEASETAIFMETTMSSLSTSEDSAEQNIQEEPATFMELIAWASGQELSQDIEAPSLNIAESISLPPICLEIADGIMELDAESITLVNEMFSGIFSKIDEVVFLRGTEDIDAALSEQELRTLCLNLFEYLKIPYTPEKMMELIGFILQTRPGYIDRGMREAKTLRDQFIDKFGSDTDYPTTRILGSLSIYSV